MTHRAIVNGAVQKAIEAGWDEMPDGLQVIGMDEFDEYLQCTSTHQKEFDIPVTQVIFNHDFAKALWPDPEVLDTDLNFAGQPMRSPKLWKYHLQQMVIAADPIEYLGEHLPQ